MNPHTEWWKHFFHGVYLDMWTRAVPEIQTTAEADFIKQTLAAPAGAKLLDVPCGNGRLTLALAEQGYRMTGLDIAQEYIHQARTVAVEKKLAVELLCGDMRQLTWEAAFDGGYCFGNSFGYFDDADNARFLQGLARSLKPGARFVLDCNLIAESLLPKLLERTWYPLGDLYFLAERRYDLPTSRLHCDYTIFHDGRIDKRSASYRLYSYREMLALFEQAGFADLVSFSTLDRQPFVFGSPRLLLSARRK
jgi:SAM-dependent methyltransferase